MREAHDIRSPGEEDTPGTAALYIASLAEELAQLAKRNGLDALGHILEMARLEADQISKTSSRTRNFPGSHPPRAAI
jgi:hypothetical protein